MPERMLVYVGTYTDPIKFGTGQIFEGKGKGIYLLELDLITGELKAVGDIYEYCQSLLSRDKQKRRLLIRGQ